MSTASRPSAASWILDQGDLPTPAQIMFDARLSGLDQNPLFRWILFRARLTRAYPWFVVWLVPCFYLAAALALGALYEILPATWVAAASALMAVCFLQTIIQIRFLPGLADWGFRRYWGGLLEPAVMRELSQAGLTPVAAALACWGSLNTPRFIRALRATSAGFAAGLAFVAVPLSYVLGSSGYKFGLFFLCFQLGYFLHLWSFGPHILLHRYTDLLSAAVRARRSEAAARRGLADWTGFALIVWAAAVVLGLLGLALGSFEMGSLSDVGGAAFIAAAVPGYITGHVQGGFARADQMKNMRRLEETFALILGPADE